MNEGLGPVQFSREFYDPLEASVVERLLDVPASRMTLVFGGSGVGKTGVVLGEMIYQLHKGKRILVICTDMTHSELRPFYYSYGVKNGMPLFTIDEDEPITAEYIIDAIGKVNPDLVIIDTVDSMLRMCNSEWHLKDAGSVDSAIGWLKGMLKIVKAGVIGITHTPEKSNPFLIPYASKLKGRMFRAYLVLSRDLEYLGQWSAFKKISPIWDKEPSGTLVISVAKFRSGIKPAQYFFCHFGLPPKGEVHKDDAGFDIQMPTDWRPVLLAEDTSNMEPTVENLIMQFKKRVKGKSVAQSTASRWFGTKRKDDAQKVIRMAIEQNLLTTVQTGPEAWRLVLTESTSH